MIDECRWGQLKGGCGRPTCLGLEKLSSSLSSNFYLSSNLNLSPALICHKNIENRFNAGSINSSDLLDTWPHHRNALFSFVYHFSFIEQRFIRKENFKQASKQNSKLSITLLDFRRVTRILRLAAFMLVLSVFGPPLRFLFRRTTTKINTFFVVWWSNQKTCVNNETATKIVQSGNGSTVAMRANIWELYGKSRKPDVRDDYRLKHRAGIFFHRAMAAWVCVANP